MGKLKSGKKSKAGSNIYSAQSHKPYNPFEEKIVKEKQQIFGRPQKNTKGNPGVSRAQASHKRKHTLLYEYEQQHKSNSISDRRIGEKNRFISQEDKTVARYAAVRAKHKHKQLYNLESSETLTHNGITLNEIEKFEDPRSDNEDSDEGNGAFNGKLDKQFVGEAHFGGGMLSRKANNSEGPKSYKDIISQLIIDSKKRKVEKQREKESTQELTDKLDSEWKHLLPLMTKQSKAAIEELPKEEISTVDTYDKYVNELKFEARGVPSDKLKTSTEIAAEEAKTRETLEQERLERMRGPCFSNPTPVHRSADDLDDNCTAFNNTEGDEDVMLSYNEDGALINGQEQENNDNAEEEHFDIEEEESSEDEEEDRFSDLKSDDSDDSESSNTEVKEVKAQPLKPITNATFPTTYEVFKQIFDALLPSKYDEKVNQLLQYAKTTPNRKDDTNFLLTSVLQYIQSESQDSLSKCSRLLPGIYELVQVDPETACSTFVETLQSIKSEYKEKKSVNTGMLMCFKVVVSVFSVSDFRHAVATAALVTLEEILGNTAVKLKTVKSVAGGLFLAALMLEFTWISKRYSPALIQFLTSIINCYLNQTKLSLAVTSNNSKNNSYPKKLDISYLKDRKTVSSEDNNNNFKLTSLYVTLKLLQTSYNQLKASALLPSRCEAFQEVAQAVELLVGNANGEEVYPRDLRAEMDVFLCMVKEDRESRKLQHLIVEKKRPKPMRLYEPNIQTIYDRKQRGPKGEKSERDKLMYKLKQERKGALREIRKDVTFIGRHRIRKQIKSDNERKAQVKKIFAEAAIQQSDLNSLKRKKNS